MSEGQTRSSNGSFSSCPSEQSMIPSHNISPGIHLPSEHSYSWEAHFVVLTNGVTVDGLEPLQPSFSSLRSRQSGTSSHTSLASKQFPKGQRQVLHDGAGRISLQGVEQIDELDYTYNLM